MLKYLLLQKAVLYSLVFFFANRTWNYYDKLAGLRIAPNDRHQCLLALITTGLFCFLLGFLICMETKAA